jgi:hypothetical protein
MHRTIPWMPRSTSRGVSGIDGTTVLSSASALLTLNFFTVRASARSRLSTSMLFGCPLLTCRTRDKKGSPFWCRNPGTRMTLDGLQTAGSPPKTCANSRWSCEAAAGEACCSSGWKAREMTIYKADLTVETRRIATELSYGSWSPSATRASRSTIVHPPSPITLPPFDPRPAARRFLRAMNRFERKEGGERV